MTSAATLSPTSEMIEMPATAPTNAVRRPRRVRAIYGTRRVTRPVGTVIADRSLTRSCTITTASAVNAEYTKNRFDGRVSRAIRFRRQFEQSPS
jgi:hypothetical protein